VYLWMNVPRRRRVILRRTPRASERILGQQIAAEPRGLGLASELAAEARALKVDFGVDASATIRCGETRKLSKIEKGRSLQYNMDIAPVSPRSSRSAPLVLRSLRSHHTNTRDRQRTTQTTQLVQLDCQMLTKLITRVHLFYYQHRQNLYLRFRASLGHQLLFLSQCRCQREPRVEYQIGLRPFHVSSPLFRICHHAYSAHLASHRVLASCTRSRIDDDDACHLRSSIFAARLEISDDSGEYRENAKASVWSWRSFGQRLGSSGVIMVT